MTLRNSLSPQAFRSLEREKIERARQKSTAARDVLTPMRRQDYEDRLLKVYGSHAAYEAFKVIVGIEPDHAANFERYGVLLQPLQMRFVVEARKADHEGGAVEIAIGGSRGPGKSFAVFAQVALDDCQRFAGIKVLYLRKTGKSAKEQLADLEDRILGGFADKQVNTERIVFPNGSRIIIGGYKDDHQALNYQGIEYDILAIEELTQLSEHTYKTLRLSARSSKTFDGEPFRPRTYVTFNPLGIGHAFVKKRFVDPERQGGIPERKFLFGTVDDNRFVNPGYVQVLEELTGAEYRAYRLGDWDVSAGAYFETWNHNRHVIVPLDDLSWMTDIWASMDYGFNHWNMCLLHARDGDGNIYTVDELAHRKRTPDEIAPDIHAWLGRYGLTRKDLSAFFVGSDVFNRTGAATLTLAEQYAKLGIPLSRAETSPGSRISGAHLLAKLMGDPERRQPPIWYVTRRCPKLIDTLPYLERDPHNPEDVHKIDADEQGVGGDDCFVAGTMVRTYDGDVPIELIRRGDLVLTRAGYKPVRDIWISGVNRPTVEVTFSNGAVLTGTPNHPVWVDGQGWMRIDTLRYGDIIQATDQNKNTKGSLWLNPKSSFSTVSPFDVIPILRTLVIESISRLAEIIESAVLAHSIKRYGKPHTAQFQTDIMSTILTEIRSTTSYQTLPLFRARSIFQNMDGTPGIWSASVGTLFQSNRLLPLGTHPKQESGGTANTGDLWGHLAVQLITDVSSVVKRLPQRSFRRFDSAPMLVNPSGGALMDLTMLKDIVPYAVQSFASTSMKEHNAVPVHVLQKRDGQHAKTYAIHVAEQHEYYANGILVKNCYDALRYGLYRPHQSILT